MKDKPVEKSINSKGMDKLGKSPYTRPVLRVFGSVEQLTMGGSGTKVDGQNLTKK